MGTLQKVTPRSTLYGHAMACPYVRMARGIFIPSGGPKAHGNSPENHPPLDIVQARHGVPLRENGEGDFHSLGWAEGPWALGADARRFQIVGNGPHAEESHLRLDWAPKGSEVVKEGTLELIARLL